MVQVTDWDVYKLPEEQRTALIALLEDFPDYCCLVLVYDQLEYKPNKTYKKLYAAMDKAARAVKFEEQSQGEILKWVSRRFKAAGHTIDVATAEHLIFTCGSLMNGLIPEIGKIAAYARGERITKADVDAVAAPVLEALGLPPAEIAYAGDSGTDVTFARAVGFLAAATPWGYRSREELAALAPDLLPGTAEELTAALLARAVR